MKVFVFIVILLLHVLQDVELAKQFEEMVKSDSRFEIYGDVILGLVCFRLKVRLDLYESIPYLLAIIFVRGVISSIKATRNRKSKNVVLIPYLA